MHDIHNGQQDVQDAKGQCKFENIWVRYKVNINDPSEEWAVSGANNGCVLDCKFDFAHKHSRHVDKDYIHHLEKGRITFQVWGKLVATAAGKTAGARAQETLNEIKEKQAEMLELLAGFGIKGTTAGLPDGGPR
eukprot:gene5023-9133_t